MRRRRLTLVALAAAALVASGCGGSARHPAATSTTSTTFSSTTSTTSSTTTSPPVGASGGVPLAPSSSTSPPSPTSKAAGSSTTAPSATAAAVPETSSTSTSPPSGGAGMAPAVSPARFKAQFAMARTRLHVVGEQLATVLRRASRESDAVLTLELRGLSSKLLDLSSQIGRLRPPAPYRRDVHELVANLGSVGRDLSQLARAASVHSRAQARAATQQLVAHSLRAQQAETSLGRRLGFRR